MRSSLLTDGGGPVRRPPSPGRHRRRHPRRQPRRPPGAVDAAVDGDRGRPGLGADGEQIRDLEGGPADGTETQRHVDRVVEAQRPGGTGPRPPAPGSRGHSAASPARTES